MYTTEESFKKGMGSFATGVAVVTVKTTEGRAIGMTVSSLASVSLRPPLVSVCIDHKSERCRAFTEASVMGISILTAAQTSVSKDFARPLIHTKDFSFVYEDGLPLIPDAHAHLFTRVEHRLPQGDHDILIAGVTRVTVNDSSTPLLYYRGRYGYFHAAA